MDLLKNIIVTKITHISKISYKTNEKSKMSVRPWYGIVFSFGGELTYLHNSKKVHLSKNQVIFLPKNSTYEVLYTKSGSFGLINFLTAEDLLVDEFIVTETKNIDVFKNEFEIMYNSVMNGCSNTTYKNLSALYKIFSELTVDYSNKDMPAVLYKALNYIENNISSSSLSNTQIAEHLCISEVYLRKLFSKNLSVSVNQHIQNNRIEIAKKLLIETSLSITEISTKCGYSNVYYFCTSFKRKTGLNPSQFRHKNLLNLF